MARRSHYSFNKRQKEIRQKEKAEKKVQRRLLKKQRAAGELDEEPKNEDGLEEAQTAAVDAGETDGTPGLDEDS